MKITRLSVFHRELPLSKPYWLSGGRLRFDGLDATFVKMETDAGLVGWGEGTPWGHSYVAAHGPGIRAGLETLSPVILGKDPRDRSATSNTRWTCVFPGIHTPSPRWTWRAGTSRVSLPGYPSPTCWGDGIPTVPRSLLRFHPERQTRSSARSNASGRRDTSPIRSRSVLALRRT